MKNTKLYFLILTIIFISGCYTYNVPSGVTTPLITEKNEVKASANVNFNEAGGTFSIALTNHVLFSASGNYIFSKNRYKQDYDSMFYKKTPNNFEIAFGYFGSKNKLANNIIFGIGTGNAVYNQKNHYEKTGYFQTEFVQYFLQYNAGFKYQKMRKHRKKYKEQGLSMRYGYHNFHLIGIGEEYKYEEIWNEESGYYDYRDYVITSKEELSGFFNSFSVYYFYRTGNDKLQFEFSPGFTVYDGRFEFYKYVVLTENLHFNVGLVFNLNNLLEN